MAYRVEDEKSKDGDFTRPSGHEFSVKINDEIHKKVGGEVLVF